MIPVMPETNRIESNRCSRKVRIVGKIKGFTEHESNSLNQDSKPWITVKNPVEVGSSEKSTVFFDAQSTSRKDLYELDYCYEQNEETGLIYSREIKPLILEVFDGRNASIVALGARGSGKTYTIQGTQENPGLAVMAMSEILSKARDLKKLVYVSLYELIHDHAYDLLDPKHPEVQILEDGRGKINLKGLSQVPVKSISEFHTIYFSQGSFQKTQKTPMDQPRNHKGLMVHISSEDDKLKPKLVNKINFVDLAGFEDPKRSSKDGITLAESNRTNKSLYSLLNVVSALNANEIRVPYRESKFTRILQDSLRRTSHILLLTCLNASFCQDTISCVSLVSRSNRGTKQVLTDSTNRSQSSAKVKVLSSLKSGKTFSEKKASCTLKGRKLFHEEKRINSKQVSSCKSINRLRCVSEDTSSQKSKILTDLALAVPPFSLEEATPDTSISEVTPSIELKEDINLEGLEGQSISTSENTLLPDAINDKYTIFEEKDVSTSSEINNLDDKASIHSEIANTTVENNILNKDDSKFPRLSETISQLAADLKLLNSSSQMRIKLPEVVATPYSSQIVPYNDTQDPKTPISECGLARICTPHSTFGNRSSGFKQSLVQDCLRFLNSANKEELKSLKGIGEKRATYILQMREESPVPFKSIDDLQDIGMSGKQIKNMMKNVAGELFN